MHCFSSNSQTKKLCDVFQFLFPRSFCASFSLLFCSAFLSIHPNIQMTHCHISRFKTLKAKQIFCTSTDTECPLIKSWNGPEMTPNFKSSCWGCWSYFWNEASTNIKNSVGWIMTKIEDNHKRLKWWGQMAFKYVRSWIVYDVDSLAWRLLFRDEKSVWNMSDNNDAHLHILLTLEVPPKRSLA